MRPVTVCALAVVVALTSGVADAWGAPAADGSSSPATTTSTPARVAQPAPPYDAFYDLPAGWADRAPGDVLRSRPVQARAFQIFPIAVQSWQLLYRSTDEQGTPYAAVTTVMIPRGPTKPRPLLSYQMATDSTLRICNPSYALTRGFPIESANPAGPLPLPTPAVEIAAAAAGLERGWAVSIPDHGGVDNKFFNPRQPGFAVLDGIRAAERFEPLGLSGAATPVTMWGYSGGGIATSWAAEEKRDYAPELNVVGAAMGATPRADLAQVVRKVSGTPLGGLIPIALGAVLRDRPDLAPVLNRYVTPRGRAIIAETDKHCVAQNALTNLWFDYHPYLRAPVDVVFDDPAVKPAVAALEISGKAPDMPVYVYNGTSEEVSPIAGADKLVASYCAGGTPVTYRRETLPPRPIPQIMSTHGVVAFSGAPNAFAWLTERVTSRRTPASTGCDIQTVPTTFVNPDALATVGPSFVGTTLFGLLGGQPIGQGQ